MTENTQSEGALRSVAFLNVTVPDLAAQLGYGWPTDEEGRWRVMVLMAASAAHWRKEVSKCQSELWPKLEHDRIIESKNTTIRSLRAKLKNTRRALRDFMKRQAAFVREGLAEM